MMIVVESGPSLSLMIIIFHVEQFLAQAEMLAASEGGGDQASSSSSSSQQQQTPRQQQQSNRNRISATDLANALSFATMTPTAAGKAKYVNFDSNKGQRLSPNIFYHFRTSPVVCIVVASRRLLTLPGRPTSDQY